MDAKTCKESVVVRTSRVFPNDVNNHNTLFGGKLMSDVDMIASISAVRHSRRECVTASTDSVDFLSPITPDDSVCFESFVTWTGRTSLEVQQHLQYGSLYDRSNRQKTSEVCSRSLNR